MPLLQHFGAAVAVVAGFATAIRAAVPSPEHSSVDPCLIVCPAGDIAFTVIVRDAADQPVPGSFVQVSFCAGGVTRCDPLTVCDAGGTTGLDGRIVLHYAAGGTSAAPADVHADGILLATRPIASPDQDGDQSVGAADVAIAQAKLGMVDPTMDLACDQGVVDQADLDVQALHLGHFCDQSVPVQPGSWGKVKALFR